MFGVLAGGTTLVVAVHYAYGHGVLGANAGRFGPRFLIAELGIYLLWLLLVGVVFMAFDVRNVDVRARIGEVLDVRPVSNLSMIGGRILGLLATVALPVLGTVVVLQGLGIAARAVDFWMGDPIEPVSLASFVLLDVLVAIFVWCATVMLLSSVLRNRLAVLLGAAVLLALQIWAMTTVPVYFLPAVSVFSSTSAWASDIIVQFADFDRVLQRGAVLVLGVGACVLAAALSPRADGGSRQRQAVLGSFVSLVAVGGLASVAYRGIGTVEQRDEWLAVHRIAAATEETSRPDIERITGTVEIDPGKLLELDIDLHLLAPDSEARSWVFSFNPGMQVEAMQLGDEPAAFVHDSGLLTVETGELQDGSRFVLSLRAQGVPDPEFGYLDGAVDWRRRPATNLIKYLGTQASLFHRNYVALTPAVHWLPSGGANVNREDPSRRSPDFFHVDLAVEVPPRWLVAGPGRQPQGEGLATLHRFRPNLPVQEVALFASDFERRAVEVQGIQLELLVTAAHLPNLDYYAEAGDEITEQLTEMFSQLEDAGLQYPERVLSLVEVPLSLRTYRGGWRLDAVRAPGSLLLREEGLPTARTGYYDRLIPTDERLEFIVTGLEIYFLNDWVGGNPFQGLAGNLLSSTSPSGVGAVALDAITRDLTYRALRPLGSDSSVWFSAHAYDTEAYFGASLWESIRGLASGRFGSPAYRMTQHAGARDDARTTSLAQISGEIDPDRAFSLLSLKGNAMEGIVLGAAGVDGTAALLAELRRRHAGRPFTVGDFMTAAEQAQAGLGEVVDEWMHQTGLPGFLASPAEIVRLEDDETGQPRYQVTVHVYNGEPVDGWLQLARYDMWGEGEPIRVPGNSAVEIGRIYDAAPNQLWLIPYLSLNLGEIRLGLADTNPQLSPDTGGFVGSRPSTWIPPMVDGIVVDDLDAGFTWRSAPAHTSWWSLVDRFGNWPNALDHGLPLEAREAGSWVRRSIRSGWGKYRRTVAWAAAGDGDHQVYFTVQLAPGRWRLDYYLPERRIPERWAGDRERLMYPPLGSMDMKLIAFQNVDAVPGTSPTPVREWTLDFDADLGETGWNKLGEYDLPGGQTRLEVSNVTNGEVVIADAIRWRRMD